MKSQSQIMAMGGNIQPCKNTKLLEKFHEVGYQPSVNLLHGYWPFQRPYLPGQNLEMMGISSLLHSQIIGGMSRWVWEQVSRKWVSFYVIAPLTHGSQTLSSCIVSIQGERAPTDFDVE